MPQPRCPTPRLRNQPGRAAKVARIKMLLEDDIRNGMKVYVEDKGDELVVTRTFDKGKINDVLEANKAQYNATPHKSYKSELRKKNMWKAASIPLWVVVKWKSEGIDIFTDEGLERACKEKLNSEEFKWLRTSPGKI